jgi:chitinase/chitodextrinase
MTARLRIVGLLASVFLLSAAMPAWAQTASCTSVAAWNPATIYNAGQRLTHESRLYEAAIQIWNTAPDHCPSCNWYKDLGSCGAGGGPGSGSAPSVQITAPVNGASFTAPASISIAASASDDGAITKVDFFRGTTLLGTDSSAPYSFSWTGVAQGSYSLTAVATDDSGVTATSAVVTLTVNAPAGGGQCTSPPYVAGTSYANGQLVRNLGQVYRCEVAGWCSSSAAWAYAPGTGMHWQDAWTQQGPCGGGGAPPVVAITAPASGTAVACAAPVQISAAASDGDGFISRVDFFDNGTFIGTDAAAPFAASWLSTVSGSHQLTAKAVDDLDNSSTSPAVSVTIGSCANTTPGIPARVLVGYWHNFDNGSGFIKLRDVSTDWDVVNLAFGEPVAGSTSRIAFTPDVRTSVAEVQADVQILKGRGKKVLLSVGGANGHVELRNATERQEFVDSVTAIIRQYGLDGLDVDFEGQSVHLDRGDSDFSNPTTPVIVNLISALRQIRSNIGSSFVLTMAPETFFVQVGYQFYGGTSAGDSRTGAYLPVIHAVRDILTLLHVQNYNSGSVVALDNQVYGMGNADFHVAMTEMLLTGFPVANTGRVFPGLRPDQVAFGVPANVNAGGGWTMVPEIQKALNYLVLGQSFGGRYVLRNPAGYLGFRGLMSWSVNWDRFAGFDFSRNHRQYLNGLPAPR